jgi:hypothetical protein
MPSGELTCGNHPDEVAPPTLRLGGAGLVLSGGYASLPVDQCEDLQGESPRLFQGG